MGPLKLDPDTGRWFGLVGPAGRGEYPLDAWGFRIEIEGASLVSESVLPVRARTTDGTLQVVYDYPDYRVELCMREVPGTGFVDYTLHLRRKDGKAFFVDRLACGRFTFRRAPDQVVLHTDGSILETPINLFLRYPEGGIAVGIAYPYQELSPDKDGRTFNLEYEAALDVPAGQEFVSEPVFIGTYAYRGVGVCKPLDQVPYRFITPHPQERDLGEVQAMQAYVRSWLPYHPVAGLNQFYMFLDAWWAKLSLDQLTSGIDLMAKLGVPAVSTRETYYGLVDHLAPCPALENLPDGYRFQLPAKAREMIDYGRSKGVELTTFVAPCRSFRPEWLHRGHDGQITRYLNLPCICFANRQAVDFTIDLWDQLLTEAGAHYLAFDGRLLTSFSEADIQAGPIEPLPCYAPGHGHRPGKNSYADYKNSLLLMQELRRRHPDAFLEVYWGIKRAMPWAMAPYNGCESLYESNGAVDDRMQSWYNQNYRFLPNYQNFAQVRGHTDAELRKSIISCLSISSHLAVGIGVRLLDRPVNQDFFRHWTRWAGENHRFLNVKRDLIGQPGSGPLDGSAHIIDDRGFIFLFNEADRTHLAAVPLNDLIGLTAGSVFTVTQLYPRPVTLYRAAERGATVWLPVDASEAAVFSVEPVGPKANTPSDPKANTPPAIAWHNLGEAKVALADGQLEVAGLRGWEGQNREIVILLAGSPPPERLRVNGQGVPFERRGELILAEVRFDGNPVPQVLDPAVTWQSPPPADASGALTVPEKADLVSRGFLGSGIYEIDMQCDFGRGGFFFKTDPQHGGGVDATLLFSFFEPIDGNIGFWDHAPKGFPEFPINWTLGKHLQKGRTYRLRIHTCGDRHSYTVLDPATLQILTGPFTCRVDTVAPEGLCGVRVEHGSARLLRFAFAPARETAEVQAVPPTPGGLVHDAFTSRDVTRRLGQWAPPGMPMPVGWSTATRFDFAQKHPALYGPDR